MLFGCETSAFKPQTPGKYPKENILRLENLIFTELVMIFGVSIKSVLRRMSGHAKNEVTRCADNRILSGLHDFEYWPNSTR